ncbi:MAG: hypothetical protein M3Z09_01580 [Acidobacteriota bacterium]|nr:hypothetical protein [Acidobacteriota bacterium]
MAGVKPLVDVSGPGSVIASDPSGAFTYCVVELVAGECRAGSIIGEVYANIPGLTWPFCSVTPANNFDGLLASILDACISGSVATKDGYIQLRTDFPEVNQEDGHVMRVLAKVNGARIYQNSYMSGYGITSTGN